MDAFKEALDDCEMSDLGFSGDPFTWWNNSHDDRSYVRERLDRAMADGAWRSRFPAFKVTNGDPKHLDHRPVIMETDGGGAGFRSGGRGSHSFRFEAGWVQEEQCGETVKNAWELATEVGGSVMEAIKGVATNLHDWSRNVLGDLEKRIKRVRKALEDRRREAIGGDTANRVELLKFKLERLEEQRNMYWRQRAKVH